jgi:hypothetical protein
MKDRGVSPSIPAPKSGLRSRGVGDLAGSTRVDGAARPGKPIPAADQGVIKTMTGAAQDGVTAGAQGEGPRHPAGSQRSNLPKAVQGLIAPPGYKVP